MAAPELTLMDLNPNSLRYASRRLARYRPRAHQANVLGDWGLEPDAYDSVALTHILHCLPGAFPDKAAAFAGAGGAARRATQPLRGDDPRPGADHNRVGRAVVKSNNRLGLCRTARTRRSPWGPSSACISKTSAVEVVGTVALFTARAG